MLCPACQSEIPASASFCPKCGQRVGQVDPPAAGGTATPSPGQALRATQTAKAAEGDSEQALWQGSYSPKAMIGTWVLAGLATLAAIVVSVVFPLPPVWLGAAILVLAIWLSPLAFLLYERLSVSYELTSQRFVHKTGILRRVTNRIEVIDVDDVTFEQGFVERMFGVGTIKLLSSDTSDPKLTLRGIDDVQRVANLIDEARRTERRKRGIHIESV
jgi:uncharacterized membrane protein YdbT with pleckstrin-like domain